MAMDRVIAHEEPFDDRLIIQAFGHQAQDLNFAPGQFTALAFHRHRSLIGLLQSGKRFENALSLRRFELCFEFRQKDLRAPRLFNGSIYPSNLAKGASQFDARAPNFKWRAAAKV